MKSQKAHASAKIFQKTVKSLKRSPFRIRERAADKAKANAKATVKTNARAKVKVNAKAKAKDLAEPRVAKYSDTCGQSFGLPKGWKVRTYSTCTSKFYVAPDATVHLKKSDVVDMIGDKCGPEFRSYGLSAEKIAAKREGRPYNYYHAIQKIKKKKKLVASVKAPLVLVARSGKGPTSAVPVAGSPDHKRVTEQRVAELSAERIAAKREGRPYIYYAAIQNIKMKKLVAYLEAPQLKIQDADARIRAVLAELQATPFRNLASRLNTRMDADARPQGMCLGALKSWCKGVNLSSATSEHPHLARLCCDLIRAAKPNFSFTSIQVNKCYASALHVDNGNLGPSLIFGLGDYQKGNVYVHGVGELPVRGQWQLFDGNVPHMTCPFVGERYTLIFFTNQSYDLVPKRDVEQMRQLGFHWPKPGLKKRNYGPKKTRLVAARRALPPALQQKAGTEYKGKPANTVVVTASRKRANNENAARREALRKRLRAPSPRKHT